MNIIVRYAVYIAVGYALLVLVVFALQRSLIYFPDKEKPSEDLLAAQGLRFWPKASGYKGLISSNDHHPSKGTAIVFHGNAGSAWQRNYFVQALEPLGYRVILAEYPGYGGRAGKMNEQRFVEDARAITAAARAEFGGPVYLLGESMGCGVAAAVAADPSEPITGLVLVTPWDSLAAVAQSHYWYLPAGRLVRDRFDSVAYLQSFTRPVAVAMADNDNVIPNKHSTALYDALSAPKQLWRFKDAGHNDWPTQPSAPWWAEAMSFVASGDRGPFQPQR